MNYIGVLFTLRDLSPYLQCAALLFLIMAVFGTTRIISSAIAGVAIFFGLSYLGLLLFPDAGMAFVGILIFNGCVGVVLGVVLFVYRTAKKRSTFHLTRPMRLLLCGDACC